MVKVVLFFSFVLTLHASYNPFFSEPVKQKAQPQKTQPTPPKKQVEKKDLNLDAIYYGFVQTSDGASYALLESNSRSFVISEGDSFYVDNQKVDIITITSNQVVVQGANRYKTIYFSRRD